MKIGIVGAGFTGMAAAHSLLKKGHSVTVFESQQKPGGLASSFEVLPEVFIEKFYHHLFTNDSDILDLCREIGVDKELNYLGSKTAVYFNGKIYPFDSIFSILNFPPLRFVNRVRLGLMIFYIKFLVRPESLEGQTALVWVKKLFGAEASRVVWEPLLKGKFSGWHDKISAVWFWARIKKRTLKLVYPTGGFQLIVDALTREINQKGGRLEQGAQIESITLGGDGGWVIKFIKEGSAVSQESFDKIVVTTSLKTFQKLFPDLEQNYKSNIDSINYINAQVLLLVLENKLSDFYWLNINDAEFPFLALVEQNNLINLPQYGGKRIIYLGNYLPDGDVRLSLNENQLLDLYEPFLKKINPNFQRSWVIKAVSFKAPFAQPVVDTAYKGKIPSFEVPGKPNLYLATMAQVYPWDRGVNYAVKLAQDLVRKYF